jgi:hypothetical protein
LIVDYFGPLLVEDNITISGPGPDMLTLRGWSGTNGIFTIASGLNSVTISGLRVSQGYGGGMPGGGISVGDSDVILDRMWISNNSGANGGGLYNEGNVVITNSTISENYTAPGDGGGVFNVGTMSIVNSTISQNSAGAGGKGGGIYSAGGEITMTSVTVTGNTAGEGSGVTNGAGIVNIRNSIVAANTDNSTIPDASGTFVSSGFNLIGNGSGSTGFVNEVDGDQVGPLAADGSATASAGSPIDPKLGPLDNNGPGAFTHALLGGSPAIDRGFAFGTTSDQRGQSRPIDLQGYANATDGDGSDVGAFEMLAPTAALASISGRVTNVHGGGISSVTISIQGMDGVMRSAVTNKSGYYKVDGLTVGEFFVVTASAKRYEFANPSVLVSLSDDIAGLNFTAVLVKSPGRKNS